MNIKTRPLTPLEMQKILSVSYTPWKDIFIIAYLTGLRISDLLALKRKPITSSFSIVEKKTKSKRVITPNQTLIASWLNLYNFSSGEYLFPFRDPSTYRKSLVSHCLRAMVSTDRIAFHSIRKSCATTIYNNFGFNAAFQFLGHQKMNSTLSYIEIDAVECSSALEAELHNKSTYKGVNHVIL